MSGDFLAKSSFTLSELVSSVYIYHLGFTLLVVFRRLYCIYTREKLSQGNYHNTSIHPFIHTVRMSQLHDET